MLRRIGTALIVIPSAVILIAFAIANRQWVTLSLDPFSSANPAYAADMPLFAVIFASLILGVLIGGFVAWLGQSKWRRRARRLDAEVHVLHQELDRLRRPFTTAQNNVVIHGRETAHPPANSPPGF